MNIANTRIAIVALIAAAFPLLIYGILSDPNHNTAAQASIIAGIGLGFAANLFLRHGLLRNKIR